MKLCIPNFVGIVLPFALMACSQTGSGTTSSSTADDATTSLLNAVSSAGNEEGEAQALAAGQCSPPEIGGTRPSPRGRGRRPAPGVGRRRRGPRWPRAGGRPEGGRPEGGRGEGRGRGGHGRHGGGPEGGRGGDKVEHMLFIYDVDGDGELSDEEKAELQADLTAGCEARQAALLAEFDADDDGALSEEELEAARAAHEAEREARRHEDMARRVRHRRRRRAEPRGARRRARGPQGRGRGRPRRPRGGVRRRRRRHPERRGARGPARRTPRPHPQRRTPGVTLGSAPRAVSTPSCDTPAETSPCVAHRPATVHRLHTRADVPPHIPAARV
jgi:hypothetical protein